MIQQSADRRWCRLENSGTDCLLLEEAIEEIELHELVTAMLKDLAYVYHLTQQVKSAILEEPMVCDPSLN